MTVELLTTAEAAEALGVTAGRIRQFICEGRLESRLIGRDRYISRTALLALDRKPAGPPPTHGKFVGVRRGVRRKAS